MIATRDPIIINSVIDTWVRESAGLTDDVVFLQYYMRGALTRDDCWQLTPFERERYKQFIEKRFKEAGEYVKHKVPMPNI